METEKFICTVQMQKRTISCFNLCSMIIRRFSGVTEEERQRFTKKEQKAILF